MQAASELSAELGYQGLPTEALRRVAVSFRGHTPGESRAFFGRGFEVGCVPYCGTAGD